ncbi:hypothetical protein [Symbioplanes lichenis]|uniref:hypothetical protein n=1 Tax=Symbioplanes lichenis TaxID=1629072 RepID=UPI002739B3B8|nr:hypothetical protein [Actinoplanes lichenis]
MRSLGTRRVVLTTGVAAATAFALAACGAGQVAETAIKKPSNPGVNADNSNRSVFIRNLSVQYPGSEGYEAGADAPLEFGIYNQTRSTITVLVSSQPAEGSSEQDGVVSARQIGIVGGTPASGGAEATVSPAPEPSGSRNSGGQDDQDDNDELPTPDASVQSAQPSGSASARPSSSSSGRERAVSPARIELAPLGAATFLPGDATELTALDLTGELVPGSSLNLVFEFSNGAEPLVVKAPVSTPLAPASRVPGESDEHVAE